MLKDRLDVRIYENRTLMGEAAAKDIASAMRKLLAEKEEINMIFAAAPSQLDMLVSLCEAEGIAWKRVNAFHMDEYVGITHDAPQGFANFLKRYLFDKKPFKSVNLLNCEAGDAAEECLRYEALLKAYPTDIVCLGIGENGHIAFNDPHVAKFDDPKMVKVVDLDEKCRNQQVNDGCFAKIDEVPRYAMTVTIPALVKAPYLFCVVPAATKADAVYKTVMGEITEACPASILRTRENAVLYGDSASGARLPEEYRV
ncbi:MAG: glucosamine-6-phosphate deaminase [Clostridia bacterium]|nr:glucosamine-6-phosphate deaminase [Clostridia bacterium]